MKIYVVLVSKIENEQFLPAYISSEGYKTFDTAVNWVLSREDKPEPMIKNCKCWAFRSKNTCYEIREIKVK